MLATNILFFDKPCTIVCDLKCNKAWGINGRPKIVLDAQDEDDYAFLADDELGEAPKSTGTWEGEDTKPLFPARHNKWCARECERSLLLKPGRTLVTRDFSRRLYNVRSKHTEEE